MKKTLVLVFILLSNIIQSQNRPSDYSIAQIDSLLESFKATRAFDKLVPFATVGAEKAAKTHGKQDTTYARMLYFLGLGYAIQQDFENATKTYKEAIAIQKALIPKHSNYVQSLHNFAVLQFNMGDYNSAEPFYKESLKIRKEIFGVKHPEYSVGLNAMAIFYKKMGNYNLAKPLYIESLNIRRELLGTKHLEYADALNNLAILYMELGDYDEAEPLYKDALNIRKELAKESPYYYAQSLVNLALLYHKSNNFALAEPLYKESIKLLKEFVGELHPDYVNSLNNLGMLYKDKGNYKLAEPLLKEASELRKEIIGEQHADYAASLNNLATLYNSMQLYELSESHYKMSLKIRKTALGEEHPEYAQSLNNLGSLYMTLKKYDLVEPLFMEALDVRRNIFGERHYIVIQALNNLVVLYSNNKKTHLSWAYAQQAIQANAGINISLNINQKWADSLAIAEYIDLNNMIITLENVYDLLQSSFGSLHNSLEINQVSSKEKQIIVSNLALRLLKKNRDAFVNETDKLRLLSQNNDWVLRCLSILDKKEQADKAFILAEQSKSILLLDAAKTEQAHSFGDLPDSLVQEELALQKQYVEYEASLAENRPTAEKDILRSQLNALNLKIKNFKTNIEKSYPKYAALKYQHQEVTANEIQKLLPPQTALLEYVIGDSTIYIFYIDNANLKLLTYIISKKDLTQKIQSLHHALSDYKFIAQNPSEAYQEYTTAAHWFYKILVEPVFSSNELGTGKNAKDIEHLIIVTDGELGFLPFESFLVKPAPQAVSDYSKLDYLINDYKISYNYSATLWKENKTSKKHKNNRQLLALASDYSISIDSSKKALRLPAYQRLRANLAPLPAAQQEVKVLQEQFQGFFGFNELASEKNFKEKAPDYAVIHLAMHGILDNKSPILSSLAFTEDGDSLENNFLQAFEISKINLNADLVVLSACETGYGKFETGNGIASLARAFMYAGVPALVVSLWQVNDHSTSFIMQHFYKNLANGLTKDDALRQAKLDYMSTAKGIAAHPAFWSPFIQIGDNSSIKIAPSTSITTWAIYILISLTTLLIGLVWLKKRKERSSL